MQPTPTSLRTGEPFSSRPVVCLPCPLMAQHRRDHLVSSALSAKRKAPTHATANPWSLRAETTRQTGGSSWRGPTRRDGECFLTHEKFTLRSLPARRLLPARFHSQRQAGRFFLPIVAEWPERRLERESLGSRRGGRKTARDRGLRSVRRPASLETEVTDPGQETVVSRERLRRCAICPSDRGPFMHRPGQVRTHLRQYRVPQTVSEDVMIRSNSESRRRPRGGVNEAF